jgi:hypothetical protein
LGAHLVQRPIPAEEKKEAEAEKDEEGGGAKRGRGGKEGKTLLKKLRGIH